MATYTRDSSKDITQTTVIDNHDANTLYNITDDSDVTFALLDLIYPVGSIYIGTMSVCPLQTLGLGTWQLVATDRVLQGAGTRGSVGDTLNESLPNSKGTFSIINHNPNNHSYTGAFAKGTISNMPVSGLNSGQAWNEGWGTVTEYFDASRSSSTYQDDAPVQQDAYLVNIWERIS